MENQEQNTNLDPEALLNPEADLASQTHTAKLRLWWLGLNKKWLIGGAATVVVVLLLWPSFLYIKNTVLKPSTPPPPESLFAPLTVDRQATVFRRDGNSVAALVHLRNSNKQAGIPQLNITWKAYDASGKILGKGETQTYVLPDSDKYLVLPFLTNLPSKVLVSAEPNPTFQVLSENQKLDLLTFNLNRADTAGQTEVTGQVVNPSAYTVNSVDLMALLRSPGGQIIAAMSTKLGQLLPSDTYNFSLAWPALLPDDTILDIRAETNLFNLN